MLEYTSIFILMHVCDLMLKSNGFMSLRA